FFSVCLLLAVLCGAGCATGLRTGASDWVRTELYFSLGEWTEGAPDREAEAAWRGFLDREVTPRFPDGLTVVDVYGQWRGAVAGDFSSAVGGGRHTDRGDPRRVETVAGRGIGAVGQRTGERAVLTQYGSLKGTSKNLFLPRINTNGHSSPEILRVI